MTMTHEGIGYTEFELYFFLLFTIFFFSLFVCLVVSLLQEKKLYIFTFLLFLFQFSFFSGVSMKPLDKLSPQKIISITKTGSNFFVHFCGLKYATEKENNWKNLQTFKSHTEGKKVIQIIEDIEKQDFVIHSFRHFELNFPPF